MDAPLTIAVAQPACMPCQVDTNALRHAEAIRAARVRVMVFPELSLTGYELGAAPLVDPASGDLRPLVDACAETGSIALAGAPVSDADGRSYIATLAVTGTGVSVVYRKIWLGSDERQRFVAGEGPAVCEVDGWRLGLAICKDTGVDDHTHAVGGLGIDVYVAGLVMHRHETDEQSQRARRIAAGLGVYVAFASFAGPTGSGYSSTAGASGIWSPQGEVLAQADSVVGRVVGATLDADRPRRSAV